MPKFISPRDVAFFKGIARELVDDVVQTLVVLYKINLVETKINLYGESLAKQWHTGIELPCLINKDPGQINYEGFGPESVQSIVFKFDRFMCEEKNTYPEIGDVIFFDNTYYEIDTTYEVQYSGGQPDNNFSIVCTTFMTNRVTINADDRAK